jgi:hypothetical protein
MDINVDSGVVCLIYARLIENVNKLMPLTHFGKSSRLKTELCHQPPKLCIIASTSLCKDTGFMTEDFKWFGEGFEGFPKNLPDDTVQYALFKIDNTADTNQKIASLRKCLQEINTFTKELLKDYIWQRQPFTLDLAFDESISTWTLRGSTNFGDSVDDEWLIVHILVQASKRHPELWIRLYDNDGEFLLIEAANALPRWLKPEIAENRVWIHAGEIRIIPIVAQTPLAIRSPTLKEAILYIEKSSNILFHSPTLEKEALYRIKKYPSAVSDHFHESLVILPRKVAYVLHCNPAYISPAIEAFYLRDPVSLKPLLRPNSSDLIFPPSDMVTVSIRFTKVGFAQLKSQEFPVTPLWSSYIDSTTSQQRPRALVGMKLTCGFEMLLVDKLHQDKRAVREIKIILDDLENGDDSLSTDEEMKQWSQKDDHEKWMDIDFNDFERELGGKSQSNSATGEGFGDKMAQDNLRKMVSRFEDFLKDDEAGPDGAMLNDEEEDDDSEETDESGEEEDGDVSFDETKFSQMMHEMMGLPLVAKEPTGGTAESDNDEDMEQAMKGMEQELREAGVFDSGEAPKKRIGNKSQSKNRDETEDGEVNIDFTLAQNMLEAFKSQGGLSGPAGNLMGLMGVRFPADDEKGDF